MKITQLKLPCIAFAAVGAIYLLYFAVYGFYPFGERSIAWCDLEQQYLPLLMELRGILKDGGSLLLGKGGGGMNLWGVFLFFVSSPLGALSVFVSAEKMVYFINILTVLKLALCGASASYSFGKLFCRLPAEFNVLLSIMYPLSGYAMMYYQNNMWLDIMIIFPLLLVSMFRLCEKGRWGAYTILLSMTMFLNFYLSYMAVLFIVISFGVMLVFCCGKKYRGDRAVKFLTADICAALMTAIVWIPAMKQFTASGRGESFADTLRWSGFFENTSDKLALLSCTSIIFAAVLMTFLFRRFFRRGKPAFFAVMTAVMLFGALVEPINKLWHTGSYQAYPLRFGFIIIFMGLSVAAVFLSRPERKPRIRRQSGRILRVSMIIVLLGAAAIFIPQIISHEKYGSYTATLWVEGSDAKAALLCGFAGAAAYWLFMISYRRGVIKTRLTALLMTGIMALESFFAFGVYFDNINDVTGRFAQTMELSDKIDDGDFYRAKSSKRYFYSNMMEAMGYSSIGHYTSLTDENFLFTAKKLGYSAYWLDVSSNGGTAVTDAFLMNRYIFGQSGDKNDLMEDFNTEHTLKIYRNTIVSDGAVISSVSPGELSGFAETQRLESTSYMAEKLYGIENILEEAEPYAVTNLTLTEKNGKIQAKIIDAEKDAAINYSFFAEGRQELYADLFGNYSTALKEPYFESVSIYVNGKAVSLDYPNKRENGIIDLGTFENKYVSVKIVVHKDFEADVFGIYRLDADKVSEGVENTGTGSITLDGNKITITADSPDGGYVYIPFAYSEGFSAEVNGRDTGIHKVLGAFMAVKLEEGSNEVVLTYYPEGFVIGAIVTIIGAALYILLLISGRKIRIPAKAGSFSVKGVIFLSIAAFAVIYIMAAAGWIVMQFIG